MTEIAKEKKPEGTLTMAITSIGFIMGRLIGGNKLTKPRIFSIIENGQRIQMSPLPGTPSFMRLGMESNYPIPETDENKGLVELYNRVTNMNVDPGV